ncbi:hypothetical protein [Paracoccus versutus]|uniref:Uncharacterized protein n=1 Tax=Paracoccus versutus TaxID=34007 RepID=A0A3D9XHE1_PARVE|nr:hypothetical protein [Paracoccus versutus]REF69937.1 hypothetical protein BDD41_2656 [Paracoccus versutus]WGR57715.1 hypothetical protein E3U25_17295 [Paracoccus versutus]
MIKAIAGKGANRARAICDYCGREEVVTCDYLGRSNGAQKPNVGQINRKLTGQGWDVRSGKLHCPSCAAHKRAFAQQEKQELTVSQTNAETRDPPEASREQKRLIIMALEEAYDVSAQRYRGGQTDATLASELGNGIRAGWVAEKREELFGPAGGNEEIDAIRGEVEAIDAAMAEGLEVLRKDITNRISALSKRIDAVCAAVGPRAGKV